MNINKKKIGWTFVQLVVSCIAGLLVGWLSLSLMTYITQNVSSLGLGGFLTGIILLISFLFVLAVTIGVSAESVRQIGRFIPKEISLKKLYEGSFLGLCTAVALLFVTRGDWLNSLDEWGGIIKLIAILFYLVLVLPLKLITFWIPASVLLAISAPIGAIIGYNLSPYAEKKTDKDLIDNESRSNNFVEEVK